MKDPERQKVYDALDELPELVFAAYAATLQGINIVVAMTVLDDPTPCAKLAEAIKPYIDKIGEMK